MQLKIYIKNITMLYKQQTCNASFVILYIFQFMFQVVILLREVCISKSPLTHQVPENQKSILLLLFRKYTHATVTNRILKVGYMLGHNLWRHTSLGLYSHFDTHEAQHHNTV